MSLPMIALGIVILGAITMVLVDTFSSGDGVIDGRWATVIAMTALLVAIGGGALGRYQGQGGLILKHIAIWLAIGVGIALLYTSSPALQNWYSR